MVEYLKDLPESPFSDLFDHFEILGNGQSVWEEVGFMAVVASRFFHAFK
jgi:hypothetical protein